MGLSGTVVFALERTIECHPINESGFHSFC